MNGPKIETVVVAGLHDARLDEAGVGGEYRGQIERISQRADEVPSSTGLLLTEETGAPSGGG